MITIKKSIGDQIVAHALKDLPNEACGYLAGKDGVVLKVFEMTNTDQSPEHFSFDPNEQFKVMKEARQAGLEIIANYHSHPATPSRPSVEDLRLAYDPSISYIIISLAEKEPVIKSFKIADHIAENEELIIINE